MQMTMQIFQKIAQSNEDMRERNLCLRREAHARREGESAPLLRMIPPHPTPVVMRNIEARKGKRNKRKENPRNVAKLNFPTPRPVDFVQ